MNTNNSTPAPQKTRTPAQAKARLRWFYRDGNAFRIAAHGALQGFATRTGGRVYSLSIAWECARDAALIASEARSMFDLSPQDDECRLWWNAIDDAATHCRVAFEYGIAIAEHDTRWRE